MSRVRSDRLYVRNELLSLEVNQSPRTVSQVKHKWKSRLFSFLKLKQLLNLIMISVPKLLRMGVKLPALHCRKIAPYCHISSATVSSPVSSCFYYSSPTVFFTALSFLGTIMFTGGFNQWVTRTLFLPGLSDKNTCSLHKPGPHKAIMSPGSLEHLETSQTNWFFFSPLSQKPVWLKQSNL